jgi:short-subunit dehydrogenase
MMFARMRLDGARAILTGASSGIGRALALRLAEHHVRLCLASRSRDRLETLTSEIRDRGGQALATPTDITDPAQRARLLETVLTAWHGIDILINNAGVGATGFFADATEERMRRIFEVNFFASTELTRLALPKLRQGKDPLVVNVSSIIGRRGIPGNSEYCASKFALAGWSESVRAELAQQGIHVLLVCPGRIETDFGEHLIEDRARFRWQQHRKMSADRCAQLMVKAMRRRQNELVTTAEGKALLWLNRLCPRLVDYLLARHSQPVGRDSDPSKHGSGSESGPSPQ